MGEVQEPDEMRELDEVQRLNEIQEPDEVRELNKAQEFLLVVGLLALDDTYAK